jgi:hypothetical protein
VMDALKGPTPPERAKFCRYDWPSVLASQQVAGKVLVMMNPSYCWPTVAPGSTHAVAQCASIGGRGTHQHVWGWLIDGDFISLHRRKTL